jgi:hypothetical protein|tara:strand:+ start:84 stop:200 length:117 start_codon:yes stop_codon:yes gene_type:complete
VEELLVFVLGVVELLLFEDVSSITADSDSLSSSVEHEK